MKKLKSVEQILLEKKEKELISQDLTDRAIAAGISIEEIRKNYHGNPNKLEKELQRRLEAKWKEDDKKYRQKDEKKPKMTKSQFEKECKDAAESYADDYDPENYIDDAFNDFAESMLLNPSVQEYADRTFGYKNERPLKKDIIVSIIADQIKNYHDIYVKRKKKK